MTFWNLFPHQSYKLFWTLLFWKVKIIKFKFFTKSEPPKPVFPNIHKRAESLVFSDAGITSDVLSYTFLTSGTSIHRSDWVCFLLASEPQTPSLLYHSPSSGLHNIHVGAWLLLFSLSLHLVYIALFKTKTSALSLMISCPYNKSTDPLLKT